MIQPLVAALASALATAAAAAPVVVSGPSPFGRCTTAGAATNAEVEPSLAVDPRNARRVVVAYQQDRYLRGGGARGVVVATSTDGGATWRRTPLPLTVCSGAGAPRARFATDPWVAVGPDGRIYAAALSDVLSIFTSSDWGAHWSRSARLRGRGFPDKPALTADPRHAGAAYVVWSDYLATGPPGTESDELLSITHDGGRTWSTPRAAVRHGTRSGPEDGQVLADPRTGRLFLLGVWVRDAAITPATPGWMLISSSGDGGATWSPPRRFATARTSSQPRNAAIRSSPQVPSFAIGPAGVLYAAWQDSRFSRGARDEALFIRSADGGAHWSAPRRLGPPAPGGSLMPTLAAGPGGVAALYLRVDRPSLRARYTLAASSDGGRHFRDRALSASFDLRRAPHLTAAPLVPGGYFLGDYMGLAPAAHGTFAAAYVATSPTPGDPTDVVFTTAG